MPLLFGVQLDDSLLVDRNIDLITVRETRYRTSELVLVCVQPCRSGKRVVRFLEFLEERVALALLSDGDDIACGNERGRDVDALAVDRDVAVADDLARLLARVREAETEDDVVETALEETEEVLTRDALHLLRLVIVATELLLEHAVDEFRLLLLFELQAVLGDLAVRAARLTLGLLGAADDRRLDAEGTASLQGWDSINCHIILRTSY